MQYKQSEKRKRNRAVMQYHLDNPEATLDEIGAVFNITKQRVWQILDEKNFGEPPMNYDIPRSNATA